MNYVCMCISGKVSWRHTGEYSYNTDDVRCTVGFLHYFCAQIPSLDTELYGLKQHIYWIVLLTIYTQTQIMFNFQCS